MIIDTLLLLLAAGASLVGCACLALSQDRHRLAVAGDRRHPPRTPGHTRSLGWYLLAASLLACTLRDGGAFAALLWPLLVGASAFAVALTLTYRPELLRPLLGMKPDHHPQR